MLRPLLLLFFASGAAALIYELVWFHLVTLVVGASALSIAAILASFMGGMAIGSALVPRFTSPSTHPLRLIAGLEAGLAAIGLAMPLLLPLVRDSYVAVAVMGYPGVLLRMVVSALVLLPPTILMGATLPVVSRWLGASRDGRSDVGLLYMANIAGGASGTILAGFYLLRVHDVVVASLVAVMINLFAASLAWWLARRHAYVPSHDIGSSEAAESGVFVSFAPFASFATERSVYIVAALSGLTALGAEVVWTRQLSLLFGASVYTFSLILAVFLTGLGIGSYAGSTIARRVRSPMAALGVCQLLLVLAIAYASRAIVDWLPAWQPTGTYLPNVKSQNDLRFAFDALRTAVALLPATLLWGASFPLALAAANAARDAARIVGRINATNTIDTSTAPRSTWSDTKWKSLAENRSPMNVSTLSMIPAESATAHSAISATTTTAIALT